MRPIPSQFERASVGVAGETLALSLGAWPSVSILGSATVEQTDGPHVKSSQAPEGVHCAEGR